MGLVLGGLLLGLGLPTPGFAYGEGPPLAKTGGFGEPSCLQCHTDSPLNDSGGSLTLKGQPGKYAPLTEYRIDVILSRRDLRRGGFELAARFSGGPDAGRQAGLIEAVDDTVEVATEDETEIQYARQNAMGSFSQSGDSFTWSVLWRSPPTAQGPVVIHVAANASDDDSTELGDWIYTSETNIPNQ